MWLAQGSFKERTDEAVGTATAPSDMTVPQRHGANDSIGLAPPISSDVCVGGRFVYAIEPSGAGFANEKERMG